MELFFLIPIILVMSGVAIVMALNEQPLPTGASTVFTSIVAPPTMRLQAAPKDSDGGRETDVETTVLPVETPRPDATIEETESVTNSTFSHTDVLLADALTEMIGLKAELYHLRHKVDSLNFEVARLAGGPPRTPPAASKRPVQLRKAA